MCGGGVASLLEYVFGFEKELADLLGIPQQFLHLAVKEELAAAVEKIGHMKFPEFLSAVHIPCKCGSDGTC